MNTLNIIGNVMPTGIAGMSERFKKVLLAQKEFQNLPSNVQATVWKQNHITAVSLFCVQMESAKSALDQMYLLLNGVGSKNDWTYNYP